LSYRFKGGYCDKCNFSCVGKMKLTAHITSCIVLGNGAARDSTKSAFENLTFRSEAAFNSWLEKMQIETKTYFAKHTGNKKNALHTKYKYLFCQHNRMAKTEAERKTSRKRKCGLVPFYGCPARMNVTIKEWKTTVKFYSRHNHPLTEESLKYQPFPISVRKAVKRKISMGISTRVILQDLKSENSMCSTSNGTNKISLLSHM
jgi:transcription elongation factor Elf1